VLVEHLFIENSNSVRGLFGKWLAAAWLCCAMLNLDCGFVIAQYIKA